MYKGTRINKYATLHNMFTYTLYIYINMLYNIFTYRDSARMIYYTLITDRDRDAGS